MDIQKIKYSKELIKNKIRLKKELSMIEKEIEESQDSCNHIRICLGWNGPFQYRDTSITQCLLCSEVDPRSLYNVVDATNYKSSLYGHGEISSDREKRLSEIQELVVSMLVENPKLREEELVARLNEIMKEDKEKTRLLGKKLGRKFI